MSPGVTEGLTQTASFAPCLVLALGMVLSPVIVSAVRSWWRTTGPWARRARESGEQQAFLRRMQPGRHEW